MGRDGYDGRVTAGGGRAFPVVRPPAHPVPAPPGPGEEVAGSPSELVATFNQDLDPSRTSLEVRDALGASLARGGELGQGSREFRLILPRLGPGEYEVRRSE